MISPYLGQIEAEQIGADGRSSLIALTESGRAATEACLAGFERAIGAFRELLEIPEKELIAALETMNRALDAAGEALGR